MAKGAKRTHTDPTVPYIAADPHDIMALLRTLAPAGDTQTNETPVAAET